MSTDRRTPWRGRTLGQAPAWVWLLLATAVIAGLLAMHGFSVGHHTQAAPAGTTTAAGVHSVSAHNDQAPTGAAVHMPTDPNGPAAGICPADACQDHGAMSAMCLFILVSLALFAPGRGRAAWRWQPPWLQSPPRLHRVTADGDAPAVSLTRLCISRT